MATMRGKNCSSRTGYTGFRCDDEREEAGEGRGEGEAGDGIVVPVCCLLLASNDPLDARRDGVAAHRRGSSRPSWLACRGE